MTSNLAQLSVLVGALLPFLISVLTQVKWSANVKAVIAFAIAIVASALTTWVSGNFDLHNWATSLIAVYLAAQVLYRNLWKPTGATGLVSKLTDTKA
jgi:general stress protein CsbA